MRINIYDEGLDFFELILEEILFFSVKSFAISKEIY
jgi:hypothetical protein